MNAQEVVDTFAPFVGTEGLRWVPNIMVDGHEVHISVGTETQGWGDSVRPHIAHGFLLSRLAEGLTRRGVHPTYALATHKGKFFCLNAPDGADYFSTYADAVLAAARIEWPEKKPAPAPAKLPDCIDINGATYRRIDGDE